LLNSMQRTVPLSVLTLVAGSIAAQAELTGNFPPPEVAPVVRAVRASGEIRIDGRLDEAAWRTAPVTSDFFRKEPRQGGPVRYPTAVRLLYDDRNLYVGAFCADSVGLDGIRIQDLRRDFVWGENDIFGISLDPQNLKQYCVAFQTTPHANQRDLQTFNGDQIDTGWNTLWKVRTQKSDTGFFAEFAIPFKSLRYEVPPDSAAVNWGVTFVRYARRDVEESVFPAIPQSFTPYRMTYAARLAGLQLPPPAANVRIEPYTLYQFDESRSNGELRTDNQVKVGGDIKWAVDPRTVVDLTVNTDFAQAEVDRAVNNLERFNIFFPEQRQFFLENSGLWAGSSGRDIRPFFSRRIGLQGEFNAQPAPIDVGLRYTQRDESKALAGLLVRQRETESSSAANFAVLRYLKNYSRENNVGLMLTHRNDAAYAELGLDARNNSTLTVDGLIRPNSQWTISYLASASRDYESGTTGLAGKFFAGNNSNNFYYGWLSGLISDNYNPDMGFVFQKNALWHNPGGYWVWRPKKLPWIRRWDPGMFANYYHDANQPGNFQQASLYIFPVYIFFQDGSFLEYAITPTWQNINFDFAPLGLDIARDNYYYVRQSVRFNTDRSSRLSWWGQLNWGNFYDGRRLTTVAGGRYAPLPYIALSATYEYNDLREIGPTDEDLETHLVTGNLRLAANPRLQLSIFYQYNSFDGSGRWNVRGSWEFQPLSFVYLVFNDSQFDELDVQNRSAISKVSYVRQF
jgi:hypothetical protein